MAAVAHVTAEPAGVGFLPQGGQQVFYDEAAACIHLVEGRMITAVALPGGPPSSQAGGAAAQPWASPTRPPGGPQPDPSGYDSDSSAASSTARAFLVSEGPPVRLIRSSLDGGMTALHRARLVELHCHATGCMFVEAPGADKQGWVHWGLLRMPWRGLLCREGWFSGDVALATWSSWQCAHARAPPRVLKLPSRRSCTVPHTL